MLLLLQVQADQEEAEKVKRNVAAEERDVKKMQEEIQVRCRGPSPWSCM